MNLLSLPGIGPRIRCLLQSENIHNVEELAASDPILLAHVPNIRNLIDRAKVYVDKNVPKKVPERALVSDHTWFEKRVTLPLDETKDAIIFEMSIEPNDRVAFLCMWCDSDTSETKSFSPQFLAVTNPQLPELSVSMQTNDADKLSHHIQTLQNVLWETNVIRNYKSSSF